MTDYHVVYEQTAHGYSAYVPALPGVIAAGDTREEVAKLIREGITLHLAAEASFAHRGQSAP
jgi:predicted RNase H-like HicB family nuclease